MSRRRPHPLPGESGVEPTDPEGRLVDLGPGPIHVVEEPVSGRPGEVVHPGPPVLFFHGIPGSVRDWRYLAPALFARGLRPVRVDLPGFGQTPVTTLPAPTMAARAGLLPRLADALGLDRFVVVGHSIGGAPALQCAARYPDRVSGVVLINSVGTIRHRGLPAVQGAALERLADLVENTVLRRVLLDRTRKAYRRVGFKGEFSDEELIHHMRLVAHLDFIEQRWAARSVACPALLVSCNDDPLVEGRVSHKLMSDLGPQATHRHLHFASGGHYAQKHHATWIAEEMHTLFGSG